uniref:Uncharacterized protein n=1 Tax=Zooxanthella nutricula TaxID=1333877 RepID=A0A7S2KAY2_9DINO|mmetsp:Transcript_44723/g.135654  ORF Transcript_44723/g.135654 Transcript_44723/m.135654 type:complete len:390 (+) Transcript_44723:160-1329(+)
MEVRPCGLTIGALKSKTSQVSLPSSDCASMSTEAASLSPTSSAGLDCFDTAGASSVFSERGSLDMPSAWPAWGRQCSNTSTVASLAASDVHYSEPTQTLIFLDWDDTLFPTTEIVERWGFPIVGQEAPYTPTCPQQASGLQQWRVACRAFLELACALSSHCCIVTNSRRPWVEDCLACFYPELQELLDGPRGPKVVYAHEAMVTDKSHRAPLRPVINRDLDLQQKSAEELEAELTMSKYAAMKVEASAFYSQYPSQSWKNIISIGDMLYERDAMQDLSLRRAPHGRERLRTKTLVLPRHPTLSEIAMRLHAAAALLPLEVAFNGDIDVDLSGDEDPLRAMGQALSLPGLADLSISRHAWSSAPAPQCQDEVEQALAELTIFVHGALYGD